MLDAESPVASTGAIPLESFRSYLVLLARLRLNRRFWGRLDPSDLVQQTLLRAHRAADQAQGQDAQRRASWLRSILDRTLVDEIRRLGRAKRGGEGLARWSIAAQEEVSLRLESALVSDQPTPSEVAIHHENLMALAAGLDCLPMDQRRAVELHHLQGCSIAEVARELGRTQPAIAGLLRRGLRDLRRHLEPGLSNAT